MTVELDHIFVCVSAGGGPEAKRLVDAGFREGAPNVHPGQGSACRRFFFRNAYLELFWISNETEARSDLVSPVHLWERWRYRETGSSPFGVCVRRRAGAAPDAPLPFATWSYHPPYVPPSFGIDIAERSARLEEPLLFHLPGGTRPDEYPPERGQPLDHPCGAVEITGVRIVSPLSIEPLDVVSSVPGPEHEAEVTLDGGRAGAVLDCRPDMPLVLRW